MAIAMKEFDTTIVRYLYRRFSVPASDDKGQA